MTLDQIKLLSPEELVLELYNLQKLDVLIEKIKGTEQEFCIVAASSSAGICRGKPERIIAFCLELIRHVCNTHRINFVQLLGEAIANERPEHGELDLS